MFVVIDNTPLYDNYYHVCGPFEDRKAAIAFATRLANWYEYNNGVNPVRRIVNDTTVKGMYTQEYLIILEDNAEEFSRIRVAPVANPEMYELGDTE